MIDILLTKHALSLMDLPQTSVIIDDKDDNEQDAPREILKKGTAAYPDQHNVKAGGQDLQDEHGNENIDHMPKPWQDACQHRNEDGQQYTGGRTVFIGSRHGAAHDQNTRNCRKNTADDIGPHDDRFGIDTP